MPRAVYPYRFERETWSSLNWEPNDALQQAPPLRARREWNAGMACRRFHRHAHDRLRRLRNGTRGLQSDAGGRRSGATTQQCLRASSAASYPDSSTRWMPEQTRSVHVLGSQPQKAATRLFREPPNAEGNWQTYHYHVHKEP